MQRAIKKIITNLNKKSINSLLIIKIGLILANIVLILGLILYLINHLNAIPDYKNIIAGIIQQSLGILTQFIIGASVLTLFQQNK